MNRFNAQGCQSQLTRIAFKRALRVESLEDRKLLAADMQLASDVPSMNADDGAAPVAQVDQSAHLNMSADVDDDLLDAVAGAVAANAGSTLPQGDVQVATINVSLFNGQSFALSLNRLASGSFQLTFDNTTSGDVGSSSVSVGDNTLSVPSLDMMLGSTFGSRVSDAAQAGPLNVMGAGDLGVSGSADVTSSFFPVDVSSDVESSLGGDVASNLTAPWIGPMASVGSNLSAGTDSSLVGLMNNSAWSSFLPTASSSLVADTDATGLSGSSQMGTNVAAPMVGATSSWDTSFDLDNSTGLTAEGEGSSGWQLTGSHSSDQPTAEERYFQSRAW